MYLFRELDGLLDWVEEYIPFAYFHQFNKVDQFYCTVALLQEEAYVDFLRIRRVPLQERKCIDDASDVVPQVNKIYILIASFPHILHYPFFINFLFLNLFQIRSAAMKDRDVMEKGLRAFVS